MIAFLFENSIFLIVGALIGLIWANIDEDSYKHIKGLSFESAVHSESHAAEEGHEAATEIAGDAAAGAAVTSAEGEHAEAGHHKMDLAWLINDVLMAFFFLLAGKEIREAMLPGGPLSSARTAALPILATIGGMAGPALIYFGGTLAFKRARAGQRLGRPDGDRHRLLLHGRPPHLPEDRWQGPPGHRLPAAARHRRRRGAASSCWRPSTRRRAAISCGWLRCCRRPSSCA